MWAWSWGYVFTIQSKKLFRQPTVCMNVSKRYCESIRVVLLSFLFLFGFRLKQIFFWTDHKMNPSFRFWIPSSPKSPPNIIVSLIFFYVRVNVMCWARMLSWIRSHVYDTRQNNFNSIVELWKLSLSSNKAHAALHKTLQQLHCFCFYKAQFSEYWR